MASGNKYQAVCVFCSSDDNVAESLRKCTEEMGSYFGQLCLPVITGGSEAGLMRSIANGYLKTGSVDSFRMIIPEVFRSKAHSQHPLLTEKNIHWVDTFPDQLKMFQHHADVFVIMPGGFGTLLELFHLLNQKKNCGVDGKQIILFNFNGFWDLMLKQFDYMVEEKTLKEHHRKLFHVAGDVKDLEAILFESE